MWRDFKNANIPLSQAVQNISELGLDGIEYTPHKDELEKFGFTRDSFRDLLTAKNLSVTANYFGGDFHDPVKRSDILSVLFSVITFTIYTPAG